MKTDNEPQLTLWQTIACAIAFTVIGCMVLGYFALILAELLGMH